MMSQSKNSLWSKRLRHNILKNDVTKICLLQKINKILFCLFNKSMTYFKELFFSYILYQMKKKHATALLQFIVMDR